MTGIFRSVTTRSTVAGPRMSSGLLPVVRGHHFGIAAVAADRPGKAEQDEFVVIDEKNASSCRTS